MKLLFDQNLSPRLVESLADIFPGSLHLQSVALDRAADEVIWRYALAHGFSIVTRDSDFQERSQLANSAPGIVWNQRGNCSTDVIEQMLRANADQIAVLETDSSVGFLVLL